MWNFQICMPRYFNSLDVLDNIYTTFEVLFIPITDTLLELLTWQTYGRGGCIFDSPAIINGMLIGRKGIRSILRTRGAGWLKVNTVFQIQQARCAYKISDIETVFRHHSQSLHIN